MYTLSMDMDAKLRKAIDASGMTQCEVAEMAGLSQSQISLFLSGHRSLSLGAASKLATALGYDLVKKRKPRKR